MRLKADLTLLLDAFIWGTAFVAQPVAGQMGSVYLFNGARYLLASVVVLLFALQTSRGNKPVSLPAPHQYRWMLIAGLFLFKALALAEEIAARAPLAVRLAKEAVNHAFESFLAEGLADERRAFYFLFASIDQKEGMQAFIEKRKPDWKGE